MIEPTWPPHPSELALSRREWLAGVIATPLAAAFRRHVPRSLPRLDDVRKSPYRVVAAQANASRVLSRIVVNREWNGSRCRSRVTNRSNHAVAIAEIVLFEVNPALPETTHLYGEGFQMLSQTAGTLGSPKPLGSYTDVKHYRMPTPEGTIAFYGLCALSPGQGDNRVLAFTSCRRFSGAFRLSAGAASLQVVIDCEGLSLEPGESWELEEVWIDRGPTTDALLPSMASRINEHHPRLQVALPPTGWCSWYCFGPRVTAKQVLDNLDAISNKIPGLTYVQIDDGYQPAMGDWLETGGAFGGDVRRVLDEIRRRGFQPAIWVAPFVAEAGSHVFQQHPDWFVRNAEGAPLRSDTVTFGGWRRGPWYVLDGTHPGVHAHLERVFSTMRDEWGCTYFKLDANFWGAIHGGRFHDPRATRIEAYRRGMEAVRRGTKDSFILGCNHPLWPSLGLIHGSRSSNDIKRTWDRVRATAQQNLRRNWQNGRLWWNDPDAIVLTGDLTDDEFQFHATAVYATGGMVLSGDDLTAIPDRRLAMLRKLVPATGVPAVFEDDRLRVGTIAVPGRPAICAFNWDDVAATITTPLPSATDLVDFWTDEVVARQATRLTLDNLPPHSARLLVCRNA